MCSFEVMGGSLTWPLDSGATCHSVALRFLEKLLPCFEKASRNHDANGSERSATSGAWTLNLEVRIGRENLRRSALRMWSSLTADKSCISTQERGWKTVLGSRNLHVVKAKTRFPIDMSERAWWMQMR